MGRKQEPVCVELGEAGAMLQLTAAFIHRAVQDPGNVQVVPWQGGKQTGKEKREG